MTALSIVIPTFRRQRTLLELLSSIERQVTKQPFEVIVVANLPETGLKKKVESYGPRFRFHETGRLGVNIARNKGLDLSRAPIVLFLDDDAYLTDCDLIQKHLNLHAKHPEALAIGGAFIPKANQSSTEMAYHWILHHRLSSVRLERDEARLLSAGNASFKKEFLDARHRFDDRVITGAGEEKIFAHLRREQNLFLMFDSLSVEHRASVTIWELMKKGFHRGYDETITALDARSILEKPHWNSVRPLDETIRSHHVETTAAFHLAVRLFEKFYAYGSVLAVRDAKPMVATTAIKATVPPRPEFSLARAFAGLLLGRSRSTGRERIQSWLRPYSLALKSFSAKN